MGFHYYRAFGLTIASELACPELMPSRGTPDVTIRYGDMPATLDDATAGGVLYQITPNRFLLDLKRIGGNRYLVRYGSEIIVERSVAANIRPFLFTSCMGALLYQRGALPLHGSAIKTPEGSRSLRRFLGQWQVHLSCGFPRPGICCTYRRYQRHRPG